MFNIVDYFLGLIASAFHYVMNSLLLILLAAIVTTALVVVFFNRSKTETQEEGE